MKTDAGQTVPVEIQLSDTIEDIIATIQDKEWNSLDQLHLIVAGLEIKDKSSVSIETASQSSEEGTLPVQPRLIFDGKRVEDSCTQSVSKPVQKKRVQMSKSDIVETKVWNVIRWIPIINVGYSIPRLVIYVCKGNKEQIVSSALGTSGGAAGLFVGGLGAMAFGLVGGVVVAGIVECGIIGGGELGYKWVNDPSKSSNKGKATFQLKNNF